MAAERIDWDIKLYNAIQDKDLEGVRSALEGGASVNHLDNCRDYKGMTLLHCAAEAGQTGVVEMLIAKGANVEAKIAGYLNPKNGMTPLHCAAEAGHTKTAEMLIDKGANVEAKIADYWLAPKNGMTPLHCAAEAGHTKTVEMLIAKGAEVEAKGIVIGTPLHCAAEAGHTKTAEMLIAKGAEVEAKTAFNKTPLHFTVQAGHTKTSEMLTIQTEAITLAKSYAKSNTPPSNLKVICKKIAKEGTLANFTNVEFQVVLNHQVINKTKWMGMRNRLEQRTHLALGKALKALPWKFKEVVEACSKVEEVVEACSKVEEGEGTECALPYITFTLGNNSSGPACAESLEVDSEACAVTTPLLMAFPQEITLATVKRPGDKPPTVLPSVRHPLLEKNNGRHHSGRKRTHVAAVKESTGSQTPDL